MIRAFIQGALAFRSTRNPSFKSWRLTVAYDRGRHTMHRITLRIFEF